MNTVDQEFQIQGESFTTPALDFSGHSKLIAGLVDKVLHMKEDYKHDHQSLITCCFHVLNTLNKLTTPPQKGRKVALERPLPILEIDLDAISTHSFDPTLSNRQKAYYYYLRGRLLNIFDAYHPGAELNLSKSIKLDPALYSAWNELGNCLCKKGDVEGAKNCFNWPLLYKRDKQNLVDLAMACRQQTSKETLNHSINLCKEALVEDIEFHDAWVGIGISFLKLYFNFTRDTEDLLKSLAAYDRVNHSNNPDVFQNRAVIHSYKEDYNDAISDFQRAAALDPSLAKECNEQVTKLQQFVNILRESFALHMPIQQSTVELYKSELKTHIPPFKNLDLTCTQNLKLGLNRGSVIRIKLLGNVHRPHDIVARTYIAIDEEGHQIAITIYNIKHDIVKLKDLIAIAHPNIIESDTRKIICVHEPLCIAINGTLHPKAVQYTLCF